MQTEEFCRFRVVAPGMSKRISGVTTSFSQINKLISAIVPVRTFGHQRIGGINRLTLSEVLFQRSVRTVWHARRNNEALLGLALRIGRPNRFKVVYTYARQRPPSWITRWILSSADAVVAVSQQAASQLAVKSQIIPHGIDTERFHLARAQSGFRAQLGLRDGAFLVGCFGRIREDKGVETAVLALTAILAEYPTLHAVFVGLTATKDAPFVTRLKAHIEGAGWTDRFHFVPEVAFEEMPGLYQSLDIYLAPSWSEGFGLTVAEAMACGIPVIATDVGAVRELVENGNAGVVVPPQDEKALERAIVALIESPLSCVEMGKNGLYHIGTQFSLQAEAENLVRLYTSLIESPTENGQA